MDQLVSALREVPYFQDLPPEAIEGIARRAQLRDVTVGEPIIMQGQECAGLGVVVAGQVRVSRSSPEGREQVLRILGPGRTFNDAAAIDGEPNPGTVTAAENGVVVLIPRQAVLRLLDEYPAVSAAMLHLLAYRLRSLVDLTEDSALHSVVARVARLLLRCSEGDQPLVEGVPDACVRITQQDIAALTGSVREVVQRALKLLEQEGAIRMARARIHVLDARVLRDYAEDQR